MKVITSGFYNPIHVGHLRYLQSAFKLGFHIAIVNSDVQVKLKGSTPFMTQEDRLEIINGLSCVDLTFLAIDEDGTVNKTLRQIKRLFPDDRLIFAKGGDRAADNIPEYDTCKELGIDMIFAIGGGKIRASSELIKRISDKSNQGIINE